VTFGSNIRWHAARRNNSGAQWGRFEGNNMKNMREIGYEEANAYLMWLKEEGIPIIDGWAIQDLKTVPLAPWPRTGGLGVYVNLTGSEEQTGAYICEIPVGKSLLPEKHMYEELIYIATGSGTCTVWNDGAEDQKVTLEWTAGSVFAPP